MNVIYRHLLDDCGEVPDDFTSYMVDAMLQEMKYECMGTLRRLQ